MSTRESIASCPKCHAPIYADHQYAWCQKCGTELPDSVREQLGRAAPSPDPTPTVDAAESTRASVREPDLESLALQHPGRVSIVIVGVCTILALPTLLGADEYLGHRLLAWGAKDNESIAAGQWWRLVSAAFLHGGWFHLLFNAYALFVVGSLVERAYGRTRFLVVYVLSAIVGSFASYYASTNLSVGASGAIFGLMGAAMLAGVRGHTDLRPLLRGRAGVALAGWCAYALLRGFADPSVDNAAHVGGLVAGLATALVLPAGPVALALAATTAATLMWAGVGVARSVGMLSSYIAFSRGVEAQTRNDPAAAEQAFSAGLKFPPARLNRASLRLEQGEYAAALADLDTVLQARLDEEMFELAHLNRGAALVALERPADALASTAAVAQSRDASRRQKMLLIRGEALRALKQPESALAALDSAATSPDSGVAYDASFQRGELLDSLGRRAEAATAYRAAGALVEDAAAWLNAYRAYQAAGQRQKAREVLDSAVAVARRVVAATHETDARALDLLAQALEATGQGEAAGVWRRKAKAL